MAKRRFLVRDVAGIMEHRQAGGTIRAIASSPGGRSGHDLQIHEESSEAQVSCRQMP